MAFQTPLHLHITPSICVVKITDGEKTRVIKRIVRNTPEECRALEYEASILRKLDHPCIYKLYECRSWQDETNKYCCEIEIEGFAGSLEEEIRKHRQGFDEHEVECMLWDIASALAYAQGKNVTHRDVKPSNILVSPGRRYTLADFGEGKFVNPDNDGIHTVRGTPFFCSPEMKKNMGSGERYAGYEPFFSDVYSLGVSALNMFYPDLVKGPFSPSHFQEVLSQQSLSPHLRGLLERMLEQDSQRRGDCKSICSLLRQVFRAHYEVDRKTRELGTELRTCDNPQADSPSLVRVRNSLTELMSLPVDIAAWLLPTEQCIVCKEVFQVNDSAAWRSAQQEPNVVTTNLCSQRCYLTAAKRGQMAPNCLSCGVNLQGKFSYFLHCRVHIYCRVCKDGIKGKFFGKWRICPQCEFLKVTKRPFRMELVSISFEGFEEFQFVYDENAPPTANPKNLFPSDLHPAVKSPHCHKCEAPIHCYQHWFLIICGDQPNYLCSYRCLQALFPDSQTKSVRCPKCSAEIRNSQAAVLQEGGIISSWLAPLNSHCRICMLRPSVTTLPCSHSYCAVCLNSIDRRTKHRNFYCLLCGLRQSQEELREGVALGNKY